MSLLILFNLSVLGVQPIYSQNNRTLESTGDPIDITAIISTIIGAAAGLGGLFWGLYTYRKEQLLKRKDILFPLIKELDEESKEIVYTKNILDDRDIITRFMQFAEELFTENRHDHNHRPSVNSCLVRVPGTLNSKCIDPITGTYTNTKDPEVKILQRWGGQRPAINPILRDFRRWLINESINSKIELLQIQQKKQRYYYNNSSNNNNDKNSNGIKDSNSLAEKLLQTPIADGRRLVSYFVLSRYLINVKHLNPEQAYAVMKVSATRCNEVEGLRPSVRDFDNRIRYDIKEAVKSGKLPIGKELLRKINAKIYGVLM